MLIFCFPSTNFPLVQFPNHHTTSSLVQLQHSRYDDVPKLKTWTFTRDDLSALKVCDGSYKFSVGSVFPATSSSVPTFMH